MIGSSEKVRRLFLVNVFTQNIFPSKIEFPAITINNELLFQFKNRKLTILGKKYNIPAGQMITWKQTDE
jgi:hypothetical protein